MIKRFWKPSITSQFKICPVPYHMDTYRGCIYDCKYCFARDFVTFSRRNKKTEQEKKFSYLEGNRPDLLYNWIVRTLAKPYDYTKPEEVALKERIPLKIGATADPFPYIEYEEQVTLDTLKALHVIDYPVEIQTKNPKILADICGQFDSPNWTVAVTLLSMDESFVKICEPNAPPPQDRINAIKRITSKGIPVMIKMQPMIPTYEIDAGMEQLIKVAVDAGVWAFNTEGLKLRVSMPKSEQEMFQDSIGKYLGYDIRQWMKSYGRCTGTDYELPELRKKNYIKVAEALAKKYNIKYFSADNEMSGGCNSECCGTQKLRNYKIWGNNLRTKKYGAGDTPMSESLGKCKINFSRSKKLLGKTLNEVMEDTCG